MLKVSSRLFALMMALFLIIFGLTVAFAVEESDGELSQPVSSDTQPQTSESITGTVTEATQPTETTESKATQPVTQETSEKSTEKVTENTEPETQQQTSTTTTASTYETDDLPEALTVETVTAVVIEESQRESSGDLTYGIASWACVISGIAVICIVLVSNKTNRSTRVGKERYDEGDKITGQKRLLNDEYYNNRKYNSYYNKDNRK